MSDDKQKRQYKKSGISHISTIVDIELTEPNISVNPATIAQFEIWHESIMKKVAKLFKRQAKYMVDNNETTDALLVFLEKYPELFANEYEMVARDMIKWALTENIRKNRALIDKIQEVEDNLGLEVKKKW
jgi:hypothetical protein